MYTTEQYAQLAEQMSNALKRYETECRISWQLRQQNDELYTQIAALQAEIVKLKEIAKYE